MLLNRKILKSSYFSLDRDKMTDAKSDLEVKLETDVQDLFRIPERIDGRVLGFLTILYKAGVVKTLMDVTSLRDEQVYMVDGFGEESLRRLNGFLTKYGLPQLKTDMTKKELALYRRLADLETRRVTDKLGREPGYRLSVVGDFDYSPEKFYCPIALSQ